LIEEQAEATEELIATLTEKHTQQMETLIKSTTNAMKEMMALIRNEKKEPSIQSKEDKKSKREERRKKFNDAPICKHCGKKHPTKKEDECWELDKNKDYRPSNWKSTKST
jgi:hypothetical protein